MRLLINSLHEKLLLPPEGTCCFQELTKTVNKRSDPNKGYFDLFTGIVDSRYSSRGLILAIPGIRDLLSAYFSEFDVEDEVEFEVFEALNDFEVQIRSLDNPEFKLLPLKKDNVTIYYLVHTRKEILGEQHAHDGKVRWERVCLRGYLATRLGLLSSVATQQNTTIHLDAPSGDILQQCGVIESQALSFTRAAEVFVKHVPLKHYPKTLAEEVPDALIDQTVKVLAAKVERYGEDSGERYAAWGKALFRGKLFRRKRRSTRAKTDLEEQNQKQHEAEDSIRTEPVAADENEHEKLNERYDIEDKEIQVELEEGVSVYEIPTQPIKSQLQSLRAGLFQRNLLSIPLGRRPVWDRSILTQETLGLLIAQLINNRPLELLPIFDLGILSFIVTQIFYGFSGDRLSRLALRGADSNTDTTPSDNSVNSFIAFDASTDSFTICPEGHDRAPIVGKMEADRRHIYLKGAESFSIQAPPLIRRLFGLLIAARGPSTSDLLFKYLDASGIQAAIDSKAVNLRLRPFSKLVRERVDVNKIGRSALVHLENYGRTTSHKKIDPLLLSYMSGLVPRHFAAQAHYYNYQVSRIQADFFNCARSAFRRLITVSEKIVAQRGFQKLTSLLELDRDGWSQISTSNKSARFGSRRVPDITLTTQYLKALSQTFQECDETIQRFNLFTTLLALLLMYTTGMRPMEVGNLSPERIWRFRGGDLIIAAESKGNQKYEEWRPVFLAPPFGPLIEKYKLEAINLLLRCRAEGNAPREIQAQRGRSLFFYVIGKRRQIVPLKTSVLRRFLREEDPDLLKPEYPWQLNAPRQLYATLLAQSAIPRQLLDALLGHTTRGREPLGLYSLLPFKEIRKAALRAYRLVTQSLKLEEVLESLK